MHLFKRPVKDIFLFILICYGAWNCLTKELQWAFMFCCVLCSMIVYKHQASRITSILFKIIQDTDHGKMVGFEFRRKTVHDLVGRPLAESYPAHARVISELSNQHVALLMHVVREPQTRPMRGQHDIYRDLRSHGLVTSLGKIRADAPIIPTAFGSELAGLLLTYGLQSAVPVDLQERKVESNERSEDA